ncbi:MAG: hypothetical protein ACMUIG_09335 [Thermoplasmatota archaeon]
MMDTLVIKEKISLKLFFLYSILFAIIMDLILISPFVLLSGFKVIVNSFDFLLEFQIILIFAVLFTILTKWVPDRNEYRILDKSMIIRKGFPFKMRREILIRDIERLTPIQLIPGFAFTKRSVHKYFKNRFSSKHNYKLYLVDLKEYHMVITKTRREPYNPPASRIGKWSYDSNYGRYLTIHQHVVDELEENGIYLMKKNIRRL